jgi:hypothetical protein
VQQIKTNQILEKQEKQNSAAELEKWHRIVLADLERRHNIEVSELKGQIKTAEFRLLEFQIKVADLLSLKDRSDVIGESDTPA